MKSLEELTTGIGNTILVSSFAEENLANMVDKVLDAFPDMVVVKFYKQDLSGIIVYGAILNERRPEREIFWNVPLDTEGNWIISESKGGDDGGFGR